MRFFLMHFLAASDRTTLLWCMVALYFLFFFFSNKFMQYAKGTTVAVS